MATVPLDNPTGDALVFDTPAGLVPSVAEADPVTGAPADRATETTLAALKAVADTLATAAAAIQSAVEALDAKATAIDTGAIAGTVSLDGATLAALETVNANTGLAQPLTDAQLRASAVPVSGPLTDTQLRAAEVPVSAAALPLPAGAATETTLAAISANTPTVGQKSAAASSPVVLASDQPAIPVTGSLSTDFWMSVVRALEAFTEGVFIDPASGRLRVVLDALGGAQTLGTVTTVATLTSMAQIAGVPANSVVYDVIDTAWANCLRGRIQ